MIEEAQLEKTKKVDEEEQDQVSLERLEEQKLMSKFPSMKKAPVGSQFLQKRLQQRKFFDSGDYNMAKAKGLKLPVSGAAPNPGDNENVQPPPVAGGIIDKKTDARKESESKIATILTTVTPPKISQSSLSVSIAGGRDSSAPCGSPTGMEIPTPETVPLRKTSIVTTTASKLSPQPLLHHSPTGNNPLPGSLD
uniref:cAMP-regulated phosphoprotein 19 n=1 Tax=Romanomermis culicivorax TaxID=13658 RepID=A0A915JUZ4_ROMCU